MLRKGSIIVNKHEANYLSYRSQSVSCSRARLAGQPIDGSLAMERVDRESVGLDECTIQESNALVVKCDIIELFDSISCKRRDKILDAAMKVTDEEAARLRSQIEIHAERQTPIDKSISEAARFAVSVLEYKKYEILNRANCYSAAPA